MTRRTSKRGNGEGSVQQLKDGAWRAVLTIGIDPKTGAQRRRYRRTATRTAAVKALKELQEHYEHLDDTAPQTVADYLERWLTSARDNVRERTFDSYAGTIRRHVIPHIGSCSLAMLKPMVVQGLFDRIAADVSPKLANYVRTVLNVALNEGVRWQVIGRNPVVATKKKRVVTREPTIWTPEQIYRVLAIAESQRLYALYYLVFATGLRHGELLGLTWADVETDAVVVRRTVGTRSGKAVESEPKSASGRRIVAIDSKTRDVLEEHQARQRAELTALGMTEDLQPERVFTNRLGGTLDASNVTKAWHAIQDEAVVPRARMHDARHMHLTYLVGHGVDIRTVADRAGHADEVLTLRQYSHALEAQRKRAAVPLDELLGGQGHE